MKLITQEHIKAFRKQGDTSALMPEEISVILKLFNPVGAGTWYCYEYHEEDGYFWCMADIGMGYRELGTVSLAELQEVKIPLTVLINGKELEGGDVAIQRDKHFPIGRYTVAQVLERDY